MDFAALALTVLLPPLAYDASADNMRVVHFPPAQVLEICERSMQKAEPWLGPILACTLQSNDPDYCLVALPDPKLVGAEAYDRLYRHEQGHCNGWPDDHTGGRRPTL